MEAHEKTAHAREVIRFVLKTLKMRKLYGAKHAYHAAALDELQRSLKAFLGLYEALRLEVTRESFLVDETAVYEEPNREANLAFTLHVGGVRQLTIRGDVEPGELDRLLGIFLDKDDDAELATLLWDCEFEHIEYVCLDELAEGWSAPENLSGDAQKKIEEMNKHADGIISRLADRRSFGVGQVEHEVSDGAAELVNLEKAKLEEKEGGEEEAALITVPEEAIEEFKNQLKAAGPDENVRALLGIVFDGLALDPEALGEANARWFIEEAPTIALRRNDLRLLAGTLERYAKELDTTDPGSWLAASLRGALENMGTLERVDELVALATGGQALGGPAAFCQALRTMGRGGVVAAVRAYLAAPTQELREALNKFLTQNATVYPEELGVLCDANVPAETARWALFLASKSLKGPSAESLFERARAHPAKAVSDYANFLWRTSTPRGRLKAFTDALDSPDVNERIRAAETLAKAKDRECLDPLQRLIDDPGFLSRTPGEVSAFLAAVAAIGGRSSTEFLKRQTVRKTSMFKRRAGEELRETAEKVLKKLEQERNAPPGGSP